MPKLPLHVTPAKGAPFDLTLERDTIVGRDPRVDLALDDPFLSRRHARLFRDGERWKVEDLGSHNGTYLNNRRLRAARPLEPGDVIQLSDSRLALTHPENGASLRPAAGAAPKVATPATDSDSVASSTMLHDAAGLLEAQRIENSRDLDAERLRHYADRLKVLNEVHLALGRSHRREALLDLMLDSVGRHLRPDEAAVFLRVPGVERPTCAAHRTLEGGSDTAPAETLFSRTLGREVMDRGQAALVLDTGADARFDAAQSIHESGIRSLVAAPLLDDQEALGMIVLSSRAAVRQFTKDDLDLLVSLASVAALHLRNLHLAEEAAERRRMEKELELARRIQVALLRDALPAVPGWSLHAVNVPSRGVSGDYYAVRERGGDDGDDGESCVLMVADVSGKGVAASLLTASLEALCASLIDQGLEPDVLFERASRLLFQRTTPEKYATAFLAIIEPGGSRVRYASAGHNPALVLRLGGDIEQLESTGPPLGLLAASTYRAGEATLAPGDALVLYTDGITEAEDPGEEEFGMDRLLDVCRRHRDQTPERLATAVQQALDAFVRGVPFADDRTLVVARRLRG